MLLKRVIRCKAASAKLILLAMCCLKDNLASKCTPSHLTTGLGSTNSPAIVIPSVIGARRVVKCISSVLEGSN